MNQVIMDTLLKGIASLLDSMFKTASRKGLSFLVMMGVIAGLSGGLWYAIDSNVQARAEWKREAKEIKDEYTAALNSARRDADVREARITAKLEMCDSERQQLAIKLAELTVKINRKLRN